MEAFTTPDAEFMSGLADFRNIPLTDVSTLAGIDLDKTVQRIFPGGLDTRRTPVSAFNSCI